MFEFIKWFLSSPEPERPTDKVDIALIEKAFSILRGETDWKPEKLTYVQTDYDDFFDYECWDGPRYRKGGGRFFVGVASRCGRNGGFVYIVAPNCCRRLYHPELADEVARVSAAMKDYREDKLAQEVARL